MENARVLGLILAGGKGTRLFPLTKERTKPAVPFAGKYRIVDFVLSNFINSGIYSIYVLTQFKSQSLLQHLRNAWQFSELLTSQFILPVPAQMRKGGAVVPGHFGRDLPEHPPDRAFPAGDRGCIRCGPHLLHGHPPDDRVPPRQACEGDSGGPADTGRAGGPLRHHGDRPGLARGALLREGQQSA